MAKTEKQLEEESYDNWIDDLMSQMPDSWDGEESAESIITEYLHALEGRILNLGGTLERFTGD